MAFISVTYNLTNGSSGDATQVDQNFTDIINGTSDGTKSFSIAALTCAGAVTLNNSVTLGQATNNNITFLGSIAASIPVGTNTSYDFGSATLGMRSFYIGGGGTNTVRLLGPTLSATYTLTLPTSAGTNRYVPTTDGSGVLSFNNIASAHSLRNYSLAASVGSNNLNITLNAADGTGGSSTNPIDFVFRSSTATTGTAILRSVTSSPTIQIPSGTTIGTSNGVSTYIYVYALDNAGTVELAVSLSGYFDTNQLQTTTGISGGSSTTTLYSTTGRASVPIRLIGRIQISEATAGTWATAPTEVSLAPFVTTRQLVLGAAQTIDGTTTSAGFATPTNALTVTLVAQRTKLYKIWASLTWYVSAASGGVQIIATSGSPTVIFSNVSYLDGPANNRETTYVYTIVSLVAGSSYTFTLQVRNTGGGTTTINNSTPDSGQCLVAEEYV